MKYRFKTRPWPHQVRGLKFVMRRMISHGSAGLQVPMRWGKTKLAIDTAGCLHVKFGIDKVLCVTTTSGLGVWEKEIPKHCPFPVRVLNHQGEVVYESKNAALQPVEPAITFFVIHHMLLFAQQRLDDTRDEDTGLLIDRDWAAVPNPKIEAFDPDFIVVDESHRIGNASSSLSKLAFRYAKAARFRLTLTGTMYHRGPLAVFGQCRFMDVSMFGSTITGFKAQFVRYGGYGNYEIVGYQNLDMMADKLKEAVFIEEKPPLHRKPVVTTTPIDMEEVRPFYRDMENENATDVQGRTITADIILTRHLRCQQMAGGWVRNPEGKGYLRVGAEKRRALEDKLQTYMEEGIDKVVIMCRFVPEIMDIAKACKKVGFEYVAVHGGVPRGDARTDRVERFQASEVPCVFIGQVQATAEAIDLSESSVLLWYSLPESLVLYDQGNARIEKYNEKRTLYYDHLLMKGSRDEVTWMAMQLKMDVARFLVTRPDIVEAITRRDDATWYNGIPVTGN